MYTKTVVVWVGGWVDDMKMDHDKMGWSAWVWIDMTQDWTLVEGPFGQLRDLYSSPSIIRITKSTRMRWAGHVARMGEKRNVYGLLVGKPERKRPLGRPRRRWVDNIRTDLGEVGWGDVD
jgi:hypothetical protein